ncbi:hypothetical protein L914_14047 [Phytophthora nicotianae]|uniref:Uncharacterized protein n=1 Tax=Phytophthora nicotianae TaxID=4792 RepID=W2MW57_PHYNI|nr:hypothetical protein L914_14047 [Phytophthora nicotianae]
MRAPMVRATMVDPYTATVWILAASELEPVSASESEAALAASSTPDSLLPESPSDVPSLWMERSSVPLEPLSESPTWTSEALEAAAEPNTLTSLGSVDFDSDDGSLVLPDTLDPAEDAVVDADADVDPDADSDEDAESDAAV